MSSAKSETTLNILVILCHLSILSDLQSSCIYCPPSGCPPSIHCLLSHGIEIGQEDAMVLAFKSKLEGKKSRKQQKTQELEVESESQVDPPPQSHPSPGPSYNPSLPQVQCSRCGDWYVPWLERITVLWVSVGVILLVL